MGSIVQSRLRIPTRRHRREKMVETCLACGVALVDPVWAISHRIRQGAKLCPGCARRESTDRAWANALRIELEQAALDAVEPAG